LWLPPDRQWECSDGSRHRPGLIEEKWRRLDPARHLAEETIADVEASGLWLGKVITEVTPSGPFWKAEPEDQDYLERYPNGYTCHFPRPRLGFAPSKRIDHGFGISFR
jgi:peptide methionine sulfoxide reductase MsrA